MILWNTLLLLQRIKPRTVVTVPTELWATDTDRYTQAPSLQPDTLGHCSSLYVCGSECKAGHTWPQFQSVCVWHPVYSRTHLATVPDATFWNLACYQAQSYERCHSNVDRTLRLINDLPEKEPCHRNTQENASFKYYQHEMSVYK